MAKVVIAQTDVREYFQQELTTALAHQQVQASEEAVFYVVNLLAHFSRAERLFVDTDEGRLLQPLAELYAESLEAPTREMQTASLKRLGDVALLIAGIFSDSLNRKLVDLDYYIAMGGGAYGHVADLVRDTLHGRALGTLFSELAAKFAHLVEALGEVSERAQLISGTDIMRLYEVWLRTGSPRAAERLRRLGIEPVAGELRTH